MHIVQQHYCTCLPYSEHSIHVHCVIFNCFWATLCKTVHPMLSDCCLSVLSVMLVYCGQMVGWINMKLGTMGTQLPLPKGAHPPIFSTYLLRPNGWMDQDVTWQGGRPQPKRHSDIVLDMDPASPLPKGDGAPPIFCPCLLWPKGQMDQDASWYGGRPRSSNVVLGRDPASPS